MTTSLRSLLLPLALLPLLAPATQSPDEALVLEARGYLERMVSLDTRNPPGNELKLVTEVAQHLKRQGVYAQVHPSAPGRGNMVARLSPDGEPAAGPLVLLAHVDVVPFNEKRWKTPPLTVTEKDGVLFGRGVSDDKGMAAASVAVMLDLHRRGAKLRREVSLVLTADEEASGEAGLERVMDALPDLGAGGVVLTEGGHVERGSDDVVRYVGLQRAQKRSMTIKLVAYGEGGHSSQPPKDLAVARLARAIQRVSEHRFPVRFSTETREMFTALANASSLPEAELVKEVARGPESPGFQAAADKLSDDPFFHAMLRTTCVVTMLEASDKANVVASTATATLNCRLAAPDEPHQIAWQMVDIVKDPRVVIERGKSWEPPPASAVGGEVFDVVTAVASRRWPGAPVVPFVSMGGTDAWTFRARGIPAYGFLPFPMTRDELRAMHGDDERMKVSAFATGTLALRDVVEALAVRQ
ncbi:MAG: M20/M25/M40 family metallo-hydrolase [Myxococcota bacterium]